MIIRYLKFSRDYVRLTNRLDTITYVRSMSQFIFEIGSSVFNTKDAVMYYITSAVII